MPVRLWLHDVADSDSETQNGEAAGDTVDEIAVRFGFVPYRDLWQLRCELPRPEPFELETRAFTDNDVDEFLEVNNRAFAWHPEQSNMTAFKLGSLMSEDWFNPHGFLLHHRDGQLAAFCWTKVHEAQGNTSDPALGEIYVIAVDPGFAGQGLGGLMTLAGLKWLSDQGLRIGMLYVESDNDRANAVYRKIGFWHHRTDRAYWRDAT